MVSLIGLVLQMAYYEEIAAVVLAGGSGSRAGYVEKALLEFDGAPLLTHIIDKLSQITKTIIISVRDEAQKKLFSERFTSITTVVDKHHDIGPLAGIEAGLSSSDKEYTLVLGCDMPFLNLDVLRYIVERCEGFDVTIPRWSDGRLEPLHAVYRTGVMLDEVKRSIKYGERFILAPTFKRELIQYIDVNELREFDPSLNTFRNVNTEDDLKNIFSTSPKTL